MPESHSRVSYQTFTKAASNAYAGLSTLGKAVAESGLENELVELVKLRVSQLNGCAFCLQYHLNSARKLNIDPGKLDLLAAWREAGIFSPREMVALGWAEDLTSLDGKGVSDKAWATLREQFTEEEAIFLTVAIGTINNWNRIGVGLSFAPPVAHKVRD